MKNRKNKNSKKVDSKLENSARVEYVQVANSELEFNHFEYIGIYKLLKHDLFLAAFILTFINAGIFIFYKVIRPSFSLSINDSQEDLTYFNNKVEGKLTPYQDIINLHGQFISNNSPEFLISRDKLSEVAGIDPIDNKPLITNSDFINQNKGIVLRNAP